jgi:hypothetical protein
VITSHKKNTAPPVKIERGTDHVVIHPRNTLRAKAAIPLDGKPSMDETAIRRAEQALKALSVNFNGWMEDGSDPDTFRSPWCNPRKGCWRRPRRCDAPRCS